MMYKILGFTAFIAIFLFPHTANTVTLPEGTIVTSPEHSSVYEIRDGKRHAFSRPEVFYTWHDSYAGLQTISVAALESIELGDPMPVNENTKLIKFPLNPRIYAVTDYAYIQHIPDTETARALFGAAWESNIIELPEIYYLFYETGSALEHVDAPAPRVESPRTESISTATCSDAAYSVYETDTYVLCYLQMNFSDGSPVTFSLYDGGPVNGEVTTLTGYDSLVDYRRYVESLSGVSDIKTTRNVHRVYRIQYNIAKGGGSDYYVAYFNAETNQVVLFSYGMASNTDSTRLVSETQNFRFKTDRANSLFEHSDALTSETCAGHPTYTRYVRNFVRMSRNLDERFEFCVPSQLTLVPDTTTGLIQLRGSVSDEDFNLIFAGTGTSFDTIDEEIAAHRADDTYDVVVEELSNGYTLLTYKYQKPGGNEVWSIHVLNEYEYLFNGSMVDDLQNFYISFEDEDIDVHADTIMSVKNALAETFMFW